MGLTDCILNQLHVFYEEAVSTIWKTTVHTYTNTHIHTSTHPQTLFYKVFEKALAAIEFFRDVPHSLET